MMCVTATGCSAAEVLSSPPQPQITGGFTADCSVTAYIIPPGENAESETEFTFSGQTKRLGSGFWSMEITSPETIAGLTVSSADDVLTSHLGDLTFDVQTSSLPDSSPLTAFFSAMDNAAAQLESTSLSAGEDGGWVYSGDGCTIIFDSCGVPVSLATGQPKMTVSFSNFTAGGYPRLLWKQLPQQSVKRKFRHLLRLQPRQLLLQLLSQRPYQQNFQQLLLKVSRKSPFQLRIQLIPKHMNLLRLLFPHRLKQA